MADSNAMAAPVARTDDIGSPETCPGTGKCHGSLSWCSTCDVVDLVCDQPVCDTHAYRREEAEAAAHERFMRAAWRAEGRPSNGELLDVLAFVRPALVLARSRLGVYGAGEKMGHALERIDAVMRRTP